MTEWEEKRLLRLSRCYHNEKLYVVKLRAALERIVEMCEKRMELGDLSMLGCKELAEGSLNVPRPPGPFAAERGGEIYTGHPLPEYLHLPMRPGDDYVEVDP